MNTHLTDYIDEFLADHVFLSVNDRIKSSAPQILAFICQNLDGQDHTSVTLEVLKRALDDMPRLGLDPAIIREAPALLTAYFDFLSTTGRFPPASNWSRDVELLKAEFQKKIRDDGSVRGETYKKKYTDVNRNDPCPCGSGKKFKKCCMSLLTK